MKPYHYLATVYDILQDEIDYAAWYRNFVAWSAERGYALDRILEVGAGTGNMTAHFIDAGSFLTALEPSEAMLQVLVDKLGHNRRQLSYFCGDVASFQTAQQYDALVGFLDVLNYVVRADLTNFWQRVTRLTKPGGLVYFDMSTIYKLERVIGDNSFAESLTDFAYIWQNDYDAVRRQLNFDLTLFAMASDGSYQRYDEKHCQYGYTVSEIVASLPPELHLIEALGEQFGAPQPTDQRLHLFFERR